MKIFLSPTIVVIIALILSGGLALISGGKINWEGIGKDAITYYFVYLRGKDDAIKTENNDPK